MLFDCGVAKASRACRFVEGTFFRYTHSTERRRRGPDSTERGTRGPDSTERGTRGRALNRAGETRSSTQQSGTDAVKSAEGRPNTHQALKTRQEGSQGQGRAKRARSPWIVPKQRVSPEGATDTRAAVFCRPFGPAILCAAIQGCGLASLALAPGYLLAAPSALGECLDRTKGARRMFSRAEGCSVNVWPRRRRSVEGSGALLCDGPDLLERQTT